MEIRPSKIFVFRFTEEDLYLFVRLLEHVLELGPGPREFDDTERGTLQAHWRELSRTLDTAHDDDWMEEASANTSSEAAPHRQRPVCQVHQKPMWHQSGKHGWFWSCHERTADGSYCTYRPEKAAA